MSETQTETKMNKENQIEIRKKVYLYIHNDNLNEKALQPLLLVNGDRIHIAFLKKKWNADMYYIFQERTYMKIWLDKKGNLLTFFSNWNGDMFISKPQKEEYIDGFHYTKTDNELICENKDNVRKKLILEGFNILQLAVNQFYEDMDAIFYLICNKFT